MEPYRIYALIGNDNSVTLRGQARLEAAAVQEAERLQAELEAEHGKASVYVLDDRNRVAAVRP